MSHSITGNVHTREQFSKEGPPSPIYLTILRNGDTNIIDLAEMGSLIPRSETQVDTAFLHDLGVEITRLTTPGYNRKASRDAGGASTLTAGSTAPQDLQQIGELIFSHLLTEPARKKLRTAAPCNLYLRLDEQLIQVPWELCYDGQDFLCTKFRVGRQVITTSSIRETPIEHRQNGQVRILLIADPTESLPQANIEAERLCTLLDHVPGVEVTLVGGKEVRKMYLLTALQAHDIVHFAGHSYYDAGNPRSSGWRLHDGVLAAGELSKLSRPPLLVFSNSCQAGATAEWERNPHYEGQAFGIGSAFLLAGVKNFIGTFWVANDEESFFFAAAFYQGLTSGSSLGEALLHARQEIIQQKGRESLTWASYMLYGDPAFTLFPTTAVERLSRPLPPSPPQKARPESTKSTPQVQQEQQYASAPLPENKVKGRWLSQPAPPLKRLTAFASAAVVLFLGFFLLFKSLVSSTLPPQPLWQAYAQAFADLRAGRVGVAQAAFQRLTANPNNTFGLGYDGLAAIALEQGFLDKAKETLQKSLTANPANPLALLIQGDMYYSLGENEHAHTAYRQAIEAQAVEGWQQALAYNAFGVSVALAGRDSEARSAFKQAFKADEKSYEAASNLGYLSWQMGDLPEARRWFTKALQSQPGDELAKTFLEEILPAMSSSLPPKTVSEVLIIPFASRVGLPRRLGEGNVFAWKLVRVLAPTTRAEILSQNFLQGKRSHETGSTYAALFTLAKEKRFPFLVIGKLASFPTTLFVRGQVIATATATEQTLDHVERAENSRFEAAARVLAEQIARAASEAKTKPQEQEEAEWSPTPALSQQQLNANEKKAPKPARRDQEEPQRSSQSSWRQWIYQDLPSRDERNWPWRK